MVLLEDETHHLFVELSEATRVQLDQAYDVSGTLDTSISPPVLRMGVVSPTEKRFVVSKPALSKAVTELVAGDFSGQLVRTEGTYAGTIDVRGQRGFLLQANRNLLPVFVNDLPVQEIVAGTKVDVIGIWIQQKSLVGFNIGSCALHARTQGVHYGTQIPWLLLSVLGVAGSLTAASGAWVWALRKQVRRKTRQVLDSVAEKRKTEEQYANIFIHAHVLVMTTDVSGRVIAINPAAVRQIGRSEQELIGTDVTRLVEPACVVIVRELLNEAIGSGQTVTRRVQLLKKDGKQIPHEVSCWKMQSEGDCSLHLIWHDISERLRIEQQRSEMEQRMLSMQKMESLGVLAGGIAHDFNNLLTVIVGNASFLQASGKMGFEERNGLCSIQTAASRAAELTQQMLAYAGRGRFDVRVVDVSKLVSDMSSLLVASVSNSIRIEFCLHEKLPGVKADATQLKQILMNLVRNASEAMEGRQGIIKIQSRLVAELPESESPSHFLNFADGVSKRTTAGFVCLEVMDDGMGIEEAVMPSIFDPFFTTKFSGRGLGLSTVIGIVKNHHGCLDVWSKKGQGTRLSIFLPACAEPAALMAAPHFIKRPLDAPSHVLVVDDEPSILKVIAKTLERIGLQVTTCSSGEEVIGLLADHRHRFDCLVSDLTMPTMSGLELCKAIEEMQIGLPVVLCTGYSVNLAESSKEAPGVRAVLQKPFKSDELLRVVKEVLAESRRSSETGRGVGTL